MADPAPAGGFSLGAPGGGAKKKPGAARKKRGNWTHFSPVCRGWAAHVQLVRRTTASLFSVPDPLRHLVHGQAPRQAW